MKHKSFLIFIAVLLLALAVGVSAQDEPIELRITWYDDGNEGAVLRDLLDRFEADNDDIEVVIDTVAYTSILETLPLQIQAGEGPDMARITNIPGLRGYYLDLSPYIDVDYWETSFPPIVLDAMRAEGDDTGIYGFPNQFTVTGPYINATLFEQAGIEVPGPGNDWNAWTTVAQEVAAATDTPYAIAIDRTGHRLAGPAMSMGASYFDAEGNITIDSEGFREMSEILKGWHDDGITPAEVWLGSGGSYAAAADFFINGQLVLYMSGSWQVGRFSADIGDAFDWAVIENPTGIGGTTAMPGGSALLAVGSTEHPEEVARVMEYLVSEPVYREFTARTLFIPGHIGLGEVAYDTESELARNALNGFGAQVANIQEQAYALNFHPQNFVVFNETRDRLTQWMLGELTLDEAITRSQQAIDEAIAAAGQ